LATATTNDADEIRRLMAQIRRELHTDVREVVASAEAVTDWRRYIRNAPWVALGVSVAVGYLIVPRRHRPTSQGVVAVVPADASKVKEIVAETRAEAKKSERKGLIGRAFGFLTPIAVRAAQSYALQYLEQYIAQQQAGAAGPMPTSAPSAPGGAARPGRSSV